MLANGAASGAGWVQGSAPLRPSIYTNPTTVKRFCEMISGMARLGLSGGGGGGHHGGHHGGGFRGGFPGWYGGGPWWGYDRPLDVFVVDDSDRAPQPGACPRVKMPVLASDGLVYDNACLARAAGVKVVRQVASGKTPMKGWGMGGLNSPRSGPPGPLSGFAVTVNDQDVTPGFLLGVAAGVIGTGILRAIFK